MKKHLAFIFLVSSFIFLGVAQAAWTPPTVAAEQAVKSETSGAVRIGGPLTVGAVEIVPSNLVFTVSGDDISGVPFYRTADYGGKSRWLAGGGGRSEVVYTNSQWEVWYTNALYYSYPYGGEVLDIIDSTTWTQEGAALVPGLITHTAETVDLGNANYLPTLVGSDAGFGFDGLDVTATDSQLQFRLRYNEDELNSTATTLTLNRSDGFALAYSDSDGWGGEVACTSAGLALDSYYGPIALSSGGFGTTNSGSLYVSGDIRKGGVDVLNQTEGDARWAQLAAVEEAIVNRTDEHPLGYEAGNKLHILLAGQSNAFGSPGRFPHALFNRHYVNAASSWQGVGVTNSYLNLMASSAETVTYQDTMRFYAETMWGFEVSLADQLSEWLETEVYVSKTALGGIGLDASFSTNWSKTTGNFSLYPSIEWTTTETTATWPTAGAVDVVVWSQGEQDANTTATADAYSDNLLQFIADVRADLGVPDLPFVLLGLSAAGNNISANGRTVSQALRSVALADDNCTYVEMQDLRTQHAGTNHYLAEDYWFGGIRIAGAVRSVLSANKTQNGGLDVIGSVRGQDGFFNDKVTGRRFVGREYFGESYTDNFGSFSTLAISARDLEFYMDIDSDLNFVDLTGQQEIAALSSVVFTNDSIARDICFNGTVTNSANIWSSNGERNCTVSYWVKLIGGPDYTADAVNWLYWLDESVISGKLYHLASASAGRVAGFNGVTGQNSLNVNEWAHIVVVEQRPDDPSHRALIYYNGQPANEGIALGCSSQFGGKMMMGGDASGSNGDLYFDDFLFFSRSLTAEEVAVLYSAQARGLSGIKGY